MKGNLIVCMVKTTTFMDGHKSRPYDAEIYFYAVQTMSFMGRHRSHPYE